MPTFVKLRARVATNLGGKTITIWAEKLGAGSYRKVNKFGDWGQDGFDHRLALAPSDVLWEKTAEISKKYAELEVVS